MRTSDSTHQTEISPSERNWVKPISRRPGAFCGRGAKDCWSGGASRGEVVLLLAHVTLLSERWTRSVGSPGELVLSLLGLLGRVRTSPVQRTMSPQPLAILRRRRGRAQEELRVRSSDSSTQHGPDEGFFLANPAGFFVTYPR